MSQAACYKKRTCNPPVTAAVQTADSFTDSIEAGRMHPEIADVWLARQISLDEGYVARCNQGFDWVIESTKAVSEGGRPLPVPWLKG